MTEAKYQKVAFDKFSKTYEVFDDYGGTILERVEIRRLFRCVKENTPDWLEGL